MHECTCAEVRIGNDVIGKNWSEYCDIHGINSNWYHEKEQHHLHKYFDGLSIKMTKPCKVCGL